MPKLFRWLRYLRQINEFAHHTAELAAIIKFLLSPFLSPLLPFFLSCPCSLFLAPFPPPRGTTGENTGTNKRSACTSCGHKCGLRYHGERTAMALIVVNFRVNRVRRTINYTSSEREASWDSIFSRCWDSLFFSGCHKGRKVGDYQLAIEVPFFIFEFGKPWVIHFFLFYRIENHFLLK